jgi:hypothetical protein
MSLDGEDGVLLHYISYLFETKRMRGYDGELWPDNKYYSYRPSATEIAEGFFSMAEVSLKYFIFFKSFLHYNLVFIQLMKIVLIFKTFKVNLFHIFLP